MISRRGKEVVTSALRRRSRDVEISHFLASLGVGELEQSSLLLWSSRIVALIRFAPRALNIVLIRSTKITIILFRTP